MSIDLEVIEALAAKATEGPWLRDGMTIWSTLGQGEIVLGNVPRGGTRAGVDDIEFMARARTAVPELVAEVRRLRAIIDAMMRAGQGLPPLSLRKCRALSEAVPDLPGPLTCVQMDGHDGLHKSVPFVFDWSDVAHVWSWA